MIATVDQWVVYTLVQRARRIDPRPPYQRGPVWSIAKQQLLIDSMLRQYDVPKIYLRELAPGAQFQHEVVDGQQRLLAIWKFMDDGFALGRESSEIQGLGNLEGKRFSELTPEAQDRLGFFKVSVTVIRFPDGYDPELAEQEIRDLFLRLQEGESLNPAERRNAVAGPVRDFVIRTAESSRLLPALGIPSRRFAWHELVAIALLLEISDGPADLKAADLMKLYRRSDFDPEGIRAVNCVRVLDYLADVAALSPGALRTRWGFVDLFLAVRVLMARDPAILVNRQRDVLEAHLKFEEERREAAGALDELLVQDENGVVSPQNEDLYHYSVAFAREGATRKNVKQRHDVYLRRLESDLQLPEWSDRPAINA